MRPLKVLLPLVVLILCSVQEARAVPQFLLYQGVYSSNGVPSNGNVAMEFRITKGNVNCGVASDPNLFWTSGSTSVATASGVFGYKLGYLTDGATPDPAFKSINWTAPNTTFSIDVCVGGAPFSPKEPIGANVYAIVASSAGYASSAGNAAGFCAAQCSGKCADTSIDSNNCGGCGNACSVGQSCSGGACH